MNWQPPPPPPRQPSSGEAQAQPKALNYYELLQVSSDAHSTVIRYAYRFLAAMYHPDNGETGNADQFRLISEAWKTLSDDGKRAAYDMSLAVQQAQNKGNLAAAQAQQAQAQTQAEAKPAEFNRSSLPNVPKTTLSWNEIELRLAILQVLLTARKQKVQTGGASAKMLMDCLGVNAIQEAEFALWYLREKGYIEMGERTFMITALGVDYLTDQLSRTAVLDGGSATEQKTSAMIKAATLPAITG